MAYSAITAGEIDQDSPITTGLMTRLRDNPIAIAAGDSGAPRIQTNALDTGVVTGAKIANDTITIANFAAPTAADTYPIAFFHFFDNEYASWKVAKSGGYRVSLTGHSNATAKVYKNGSLLTTLDSFTESTAQTYDVTLAAGDVFKIVNDSPTDNDEITMLIKCSQPFSFYLLRM